MEGLYAVDAFREFVSKNGFSHTRSNTIVKCATLVRENVGAVAFCLSSEGDLLSQWRGYAENAQGFSIGFSKNELSKLITTEIPASRLVEVNYDVKKLEDLTFGIFRSFSEIVPNRKPITAISEIEGMIESMRKGYLMDFFSKISGNKNNVTISEFALCIYTYKHPSFSAEAEQRIILPATEGNRTFHTRFDCLVPHVSLSFANFKKVISTVYIGPKNNSSERDVQNFLSSHGIYCDVRRSTSSYR
jgi:hypothetical protein